MKNFLLLFIAFSLHAYSPESVEELQEQVLEMYCVPAGWCSSEKALSFVNLILEVRPQVCVEIGVYEGASLFPTAAALRFLGNGVVYAIDPWDFYESIRNYDPVSEEKFYRWWSKIDLDITHRNFLFYLKYFDLGKYCKILRKNSIEAAEEIPLIDILHLDGDHSEYMSLKDVEVYLPKVRSGGYIWLNDALWKERGDAVDLLLEYCDVVQLINGANCILFKKR